MIAKPNDVFIKPFYANSHHSGIYVQGQSYSSSAVSERWIFYMVKNTNLDGNNRIDRNDPHRLYVTNLDGQNLKALTLETENVVEYYFNSKSNALLIVMQKDVNKDGEFTAKDQKYYMKILRYNDLTQNKTIKI